MIGEYTFEELHEDERQLIEDVKETLVKALCFGVEGEMICQSKDYDVRFTLIEKSQGKLYRDRTWLEAEYVEEGRSMADIGRQFGITAAAVHQWLNKFNIPTRRRPGR